MPLLLLVRCQKEHSLIGGTSDGVDPLGGPVECSYRADSTFACKVTIMRITAMTEGTYRLEGNRMFTTEKVVDVEVPEDLDQTKKSETIAALNEIAGPTEFVIEWRGENQMYVRGVNEEEGVVLTRTPPQ
jgi:hypothetical protein